MLRPMQWNLLKNGAIWVSNLVQDRNTAQRHYTTHHATDDGKLTIDVTFMRGFRTAICGMMMH